MVFFHCTESSSDYVAVNEELTFASCDTQLCVSVRITDDLISEPDEMFAVSLTTPTDSPSFITLSSVTAEVVITDNDGNNNNNNNSNGSHSIRAISVRDCGFGPQYSSD